MSQSTAVPDRPPAPPTRRALILGLILALIGGASGFYLAWSGRISFDKILILYKDQASPASALSFIPLGTIIVSLAPDSGYKHLSFTAELEVEKTHLDEVAQLKPRILDVLNGYLRAVSVAELADPGSMVRLRAQMLRRLQIVTGEGRIRDLLITEFILN